MEKKKVLIVDDEEDVANFFKMLIENTGMYEVEAVTDSSKAFAAAKQFIPDLVLLDIMMPEVDGGEVAAQMREDKDTRDIPVVFVSAAITREEAKKQGTIYGGYPIIAKPVPTDELLSTVEQYTRTRQTSWKEPYDHPTKKENSLLAPDRRRHQRMKSPGLLSYICMDENDNPVEEGMGNALNVSQSGLQLETPLPISSEDIQLTTSGTDDELINVQGKIIYSNKVESKGFLSGVNFPEPDKKTRKFVEELIKAINLQKDE